MRISLRWIRELVALDAADEDIAQRLTMAGFEVEALERVGADLGGVVVAEVKDRAPHPHADRLVLVDVDGGGGRRRVVCGAPNVPEAGGRVALALPGTVLPGGLEVRARAVRGIESPGMLCSEAELGVGDDASGLFIVPDDAAPGAPLAEALGLRDTVLDLQVAPNRPDCLSHLGIGRELTALFGGTLSPPVADCSPLETGAPAGDLISVEVSDAERCPRYLARLVENVHVAPSPFWLRWRLRVLGLRPIANVVDVTNLVLMEAGHPLHAFDLDRVAGGRIVVRRAEAGEVMVTLDGQSRELVADDLLIADPERALAIAGVMGGGESEVTRGTRRIALEAAAFEPRSIRRTSRRLGLRSESSIRFERGCDIEGLEWSSRRAALLIAQICGGRLASGAVDVWPRRPPRREIRFRPRRCAALLGMDAPAREMAATLVSLGMQVREEGEGDLRVTIPSFRVDVSDEADLVEDIVRMQGLDGVPATLPPIGAAPAASGDPLTETVRDALAAAGLRETVSLAFSGAHGVPAPGERPAVEIRNPLREDCARMRTWLLPGLLAAVRRNLERGERDVRLFEIGRVFFAREDGDLPDEPQHAAGLLSGQRRGWLRTEASVDFLDIKGVLEEISAKVRTDLGFSASRHSFLHPGVQADVALPSGTVIGWAGEIHPARCREHGIPSSLAFEIDLEGLRAPPAARMVALPRFPAVIRDLSFFVAESVPWSEIRSALLVDADAVVESLQIQEDYREPGRVPPGQKGIFLTVRYRARDRTLTDEEVNAVHEALVARLARSLPIVRR
jgi:phenylalanyl-tRNA synthetase beta chain